MNFGLQGKTALIFGGSKGLGLGCARALAAEGVQCALVARGQAALDLSASELAQRFAVRSAAIAADIANPMALLAAIDAAEASLGPIDILINNTPGPPPAAAAGVSAELWQQQFEAMVLSVLRATDRVLPGMRERGWGRILMITSTAVVEPNPMLAISSTLRSALVGYAKTLASQVAAEGVTVNVLLPGQIETDRTAFLDQTSAERSGKSTDAIRAEKCANIPLRRYGSSDEFGAVAAFLASQQASYVTGSMIRVDGGAVRAI